MEPNVAWMSPSVAPQEVPSRGLFSRSLKEDTNVDNVILDDIHTGEDGYQRKDKRYILRIKPHKGSAIIPESKHMKGYSKHHDDEKPVEGLILPEHNVESSIPEMHSYKNFHSKHISPTSFLHSIFDSNKTSISDSAGSKSDTKLLSFAPESASGHSESSLLAPKTVLLGSKSFSFSPKSSSQGPFSTPADPFSMLQKSYGPEEISSDLTGSSIITPAKIGLPVSASRRSHHRRLHQHRDELNDLYRKEKNGSKGKHK